MARRDGAHPHGPSRRLRRGGSSPGRARASTSSGTRVRDARRRRVTTVAASPANDCRRRRSGRRSRGELRCASIGPATHHYLDDDPGWAPDVEQVDPVGSTLAARGAGPTEWQESGIPAKLSTTCGEARVRSGVRAGEAASGPGVPGAARRRGTHQRPHGAPVGRHRHASSRDGAPGGRGVGLRLGRRGAASYAITRGTAGRAGRVPARPTGAVRQRIRVARLGFEPYCHAARDSGPTLMMLRVTGFQLGRVAS